MIHEIIGELVQAGTAEFPTDNDRQRWFKLAPYGEQSAVMASGHQFTIPGPGPLTWPQDAATAHVNEEHDRKRPVAKFDQFKETAAGLFGRVLASATSAGNDALVLIDEGLRTGISAEIENPVIRAGKLLKGELSHAAFVVKPSFASATVLAAAADVGEITADLEAAQENINSAKNKLTNETETEDENVTPEQIAAQAAASQAGQSATALAAALGHGAEPVAKDPLVVLASAQESMGIGSSTVKAAAMDTIVQSDVFDKTSVPEYVGELWKGRRYTGRYLGLVAPATMTSQSVIGWRWVAGKAPQVARWTPSSAGTMNDIPTNEVLAEQKTYTGFRIAGGHKVDRIHRDLPNREWWESYNLESADDYARKLDAEVIAHVTDPANATTLELSNTATTRDRIMEGIGAAIDFADPDYFLVGWDIFRQLADEKMLDQSAVHSEGFKREGPALSATFLGIPVLSAPASMVSQNGRVMVGCNAASVLHSLPGGPIRVDAEEIQKGAIQHGVFGYHILRPTDTRGVIDVTVAAV